MQANTNYKVLVDLPLFFPSTGEEKIIFSRNGKTSKWFDFKKNFIEGRMQKAAATRIKTLIDNNTYLDSSLKNKILNNINSEEGIDDTLVINVFEDIVRRKKLNLTTQDLPAALDGVKALIDEKIIDSSSSTIQQDILLLAKNNCSPHFSETTIKDSLSYLNSLGNNDLHTVELDDCSKILSIFNHLKEKISQHSDDAYLKKILEHIDKTIKLLSPQQERLENLANKQTYNKRVSYLKKITNNPYGWLNLKSGSSEYISSLQNFDKLSNQSKLKTKEKKELEVSLLSAQHLYPEEDILEFILFLENPSHTEEKLDSESRIKLENFLNFTYTVLPKLSRKNRIDALNAIDYLSGILQSQNSTDIRSPSSTSFVKKNNALLHALNKNWKQYGPSGFSMDLLRYFEFGKNAINLENEWNLSYLISLDDRIDQIKNNLPLELRVEFDSQIEMLKDDLKNFESISAVRSQSNTLFLSITSLDQSIIISITSALKNFPIFKENDKNKYALDSFINFLKRSDDFTISKKNKQNLDHFFSLFFDNVIKKIPLDIRKHCLKEIDVLEGMLLEYENNSIDVIDISKINSATFDLATDIQFLSHAVPPSGNLTHFIHYLKDGKSSINVINYWGLQYFCQSQHTQLNDLLHEPLRSYFQTRIEQLRNDLTDLKQIYHPSILNLKG
jgi:hypothetical protein